MRVLVLGANGFIGSAIIEVLRADGVAVRAAVRDPDKLAPRFPGIEAIHIDLCDPTAGRADFWTDPLAGIDAGVNAAGVLGPRRDAHAWAVHRDAPGALFEACERADVKRVIHISAVGVDETETLFARTNRAGDEALMAGPLDWTILRPAVAIHRILEEER